VGTRYHKKGANYDLCESEFLKLSEEEQALYEKIQHPVVKHWGVYCDASGMYPIVGARYTKTGANYDLCEAEFSKLSAEDQALFERIDTPRQYIWGGRCMQEHQQRMAACQQRMGGCQQKQHCSESQHSMSAPVRGTSPCRGSPCGSRSPFQWSKWPRIMMHAAAAAQQKASLPALDPDTLPAAPLKRGSRGPAVATLQAALMHLGHLEPFPFPLGMYGPRTAQAVANLQQKHRLLRKPTGDYDDYLRSRLLEELHKTKNTDAAAQTAAETAVETAAEPVGAQSAQESAPTYDEAVAAAVSEANAATGFCPASPSELTLKDIEEKTAAFDAAKAAADATQAAVVEAAAAVAAKEAAAAVAATAPTAADLGADVDSAFAVSDERTSLLLSMGFSAEQVQGALQATKGSLERAADWLFVNRPPVEEEEQQEEQEEQDVFPAEWEPMVVELQEMGFEEAAAREALQGAQGEFKPAIKALVERERVA